MSAQRAWQRLIVGMLTGSSVAFSMAFGDSSLPWIDWMLLGACVTMIADGAICLLRLRRKAES